MMEGVCNTAQTHEKRRTAVRSDHLEFQRGRVGCDGSGFASRAVVLAMIASSSL